MTLCTRKNKKEQDYKLIGYCDINYAGDHGTKILTI